MRGKRSGVHAGLHAKPHQPILPSLFFANVWSLTNKIYEIQLKIVPLGE